MSGSLTYEKIYKSMKQVNGQTIEDIELNEQMDNKKNIIRGHYNNIPIYMKQLKNKTKNKKQKTKQKKRTYSKKK